MTNIPVAAFYFKSSCCGYSSSGDYGSVKAVEDLGIKAGLNDVMNRITEWRKKRAVIMAIVNGICVAGIRSTNVQLKSRVLCY